MAAGFYISNSRSYFHHLIGLEQDEIDFNLQALVQLRPAEEAVRWLLDVQDMADAHYHDLINGVWDEESLDFFKHLEDRAKHWRARIKNETGV